MNKILLSILLLFICTSAISQEQQLLQWQALGANDFKQIDVSRDGHSIIMDEDKTYIIYKDINTDSLKIKKLSSNGEGWENVVNTNRNVPAINEGYNPSIVMFDNTFYVSYFSQNNNDYYLKVNRLDKVSNEWVEIENKLISYDDKHSLVTDGTTLYLTYLDDSDIKIERYNPVNLSFEPVPSVGTETYYYSIVMNGNTPHVAYQNYPDPEIKIKRLMLDGSGWENVGGEGYIPLQEEEPDYPKIIMNGTTLYLAFISYFDNSENKILKIKKLSSDGDNWETVVNEDIHTNTSINDYSIAIKDNIPYVIYEEDIDDGNVIKIKRLNTVNNTWEGIDTEDGIVASKTRNPSIFANDNNLYFTYEDDINDILIIKRLNAVNNTWEYVDKNNIIPNDIIQLAIDTSNNIPYVIYIENIRNIENIDNLINEEDTNNIDVIKVKRFNAQNNTWEAVGNKDGIVDYNATYSQIVINDNVPYLIYEYYNNSNSTELKVKRFNGTVWEAVGNEDGIVDDNATYSQIVMNGNIPYIAYLDYDNKLKVKQFNGTDWEAVGNEDGVVGVNVRSFQIAMNGNIPYIIYEYINSSTFEYEIKVKRFNGTIWEAVGSDDGFVINNYIPSQIVMNGNIPYIAYQDYDNKIKVKRFNGTIWEAVGTDDGELDIIGELKSIEIINNIPHILYFNSDYKFTLNKLISDNSGWEVINQEDLGFTTIEDVNYLSFDSHNNELYVVHNNNGIYAKTFIKKITFPTTLPVELVSFTAKSNGNTVNLNWKTYSETNNSHFIVLKSEDGKKYQSLGNFSSKGNGSMYSTIDYLPFKGTTYYKLVQVDKDGKTQELGIRVVKIKDLSVNKLSVYPNPIIGGLVNIKNAALSGSQEVSLYNLAGKLIENQTLNFNNGHAILNFNTIPTKGIYILKVNKSTIKIIVE